MRSKEGQMIIDTFRSRLLPVEISKERIEHINEHYRTS